MAVITAAPTAPATTKMRARGVIAWCRQRALFALLVLLLGYLILPPIVTMIWISVTKPTPTGIPAFATSGHALTLSGYITAFTGPGSERLFANTALFSIGSTLGGVVLGAALAWVVARTNVPGKSLVYALCFIAFSVPGLIWVFGWLLLYGGPYTAVNSALISAFGFQVNVESLPGLIAIESLGWVPLVFLLLVGPLRAMDPAFEDSARIAGVGRVRTTRSITLRLMWPSLASAVLLVFIRSLQSFELPLFLGVPAHVFTLSSEIYYGLQQQIFPNYSVAAAYGTVLLVVLSVLLFQYFKVTRVASRFRTVSGRGYSPHPIDLGKWRYLITALIAILFVVYISPIIIMGIEAFTSRFTLEHGHWLVNFSLTNFRQLPAYPDLLISVRNSAEVGAITGSLVLAVSMTGAWLVVRSRLRHRWLVEQLVSLPLVVPGIVLSLSLLLFYANFRALPVYGSIWIIVIGNVAAFSVFGMRFLQPALIQIDRELEESALANGVAHLKVLKAVTLPLLRTALMGTFLVVFFVSFRELSIPSLISTASSQVSSTELLAMYTDGDVNVLSSYGFLLMIASMVIAGGGLLLLRRANRQPRPTDVFSADV